MMQPSELSELFYRLAGHVKAPSIRHDRSENPRCDIPCPDCGKGSRHFGFSPKGGYCFKCGYATSLPKLAERLGLDTSAPYERPNIPEQPRLPALWQRAPEKYVEKFQSHPDTVKLWQEYRPLSVDTIARRKLGVGTLPSSKCRHPRLIAPLFSDDGSVLGFRGRALSCVCKKDCPPRCPKHHPRWLTAKNTQSVLYGVDSVQPGDKVFWVENQIDALLINELMPDFKGVASTAGAGGWRGVLPSLVARKPSLVIVALDNDLVGCPNPETYRLLAAEYRAENNDKEPSRSNGILIMNALVLSRVRVRLWVWEDGTPPKADMGDYLMGRV